MNSKEESEMKTPAFTAEASLYKTSRHYGVAGAFAQTKGVVLPQAIRQWIYAAPGLVCVCTEDDEQQVSWCDCVFL